ncbi:contractile injection system tape measure protein [Nitrosomonas sp.]|uniref:contractile injection system tape measure protein n=1 Tax=Nitrosomonas sp. TaxID=42353 RepID=UPI001D1DBFC9|nr:contractile injection system tape measure protein [Nitrosomonas sp.]MBX3616327.1 hypothetical protein [Nitrosomonas sp.]
MPAVHRIEELILDCSFDSIAIAQALETGMDVWLRTKLLPVIDTVLFEFDEAGFDWRLDQLEIDLGDIAEDNFHDEFIQRLREKLSDRLLSAQKKAPGSGEMLAAPARRVSRLQSDLERLRDFLRTGNLPWHTNTTNQHVHEEMLQHLLQSEQAGALLVSLLRRLPAVDRTIMVKRLVSQFSQQHLEHLLVHITPANAAILADFLRIYRQILLERGDPQYPPVERSSVAWVQVLELLLSDNRLSSYPQALLLLLINQNAIREPWQTSRQLAKQVLETAIQRKKAGKIGHVLTDTLQKLNAQISGQRLVGEHHESAVSLNQPAKRFFLERKTPGARIAAALHGIMTAEEAIALQESLGPEAFRQQLQKLLNQATTRAKIVKLSKRVLQDIHWVLSEQAALMFESLLGYSDKLYKLTYREGALSRAQWQQKLWMASLTYWSTQPGKEFEPLAYLQALARGISEPAHPRKTLYAWLVALKRDKSYGTIYTQLQMCATIAPERHPAEGKNAALIADGRVKDDNAYRQLRQRFLTGRANAAHRELQQQLQEMFGKNPVRLRRFYQDLRHGYYDQTIAQLNARDLRSLIEGWLQIESAVPDSDRMIFLQAIDKQANRVADQRVYYWKLLEAMLQNRDIDVEAIAAASQPDSENYKTGGEETATDVQNDRVADKKAKQPQATDPVEARQSGREPAWQTEAGYSVAYRKIIAGLRKSGLLKTAKRASRTDMRFSGHQRRLHELLSVMELDELADKLSPALILDIIYLWQPQAAQITEHLLAHSAKLHALAGSEAPENQTQWEHRLRRTGIAYCMTKGEHAFESSAYIRALARAVSVGANTGATLLAWYERLEKSKAYGALSAILYEIIREGAELLPPRVIKENRLLNQPAAIAGLFSEDERSVIDWEALLRKVKSPDVTEEIFIDNAGLVLAAPYLPRLFTLLGLINDDAFVDRHAAERSVHVLQYLVNEQSQSPEYQLTLNKILCGISTGIPICSEIELAAQEQETIEGLLRGMIQNWKTIGNTSISGLRETFLQRKGILQLKEDGMWYLTVEPGVFDMLLDSLPWSFSVIKHAWMERAIHVTWR